MLWCRSHPWNFCHNHGSIIVYIDSGTWHKLQLLNISSRVFKYFFDKKFKESNALTEWYNSIYSECIVERAIHDCSFDTNNREKLEKVTTHPVLITAQIGSLVFSCPHSPAKYASAYQSTNSSLDGLNTCRNISRHASMGCPDDRPETMALVKQTYVLV